MWITACQEIIFTLYCKISLKSQTTSENRCGRETQEHGVIIVINCFYRFFLRDHYGTQCSDGGERLQVNIQSTTGDYTLAEVRKT